DGLVSRAPHPRDRRAVMARITETGRQRFDAALPQYLAELGRLWSAFTVPEKQLLIHLLAKARASLLGASGRGEAAAP
ncbi:MAG TPA: MarR family transcriptional regulator, partial [Chloroflexota bacterium]|nr:MarR family transcriptional regulator [Chloroflexota bacterium]